LMDTWSHILELHGTWELLVPSGGRDLFAESTAIWTRYVSHYGIAIYIKTHRKAKEELWKLKHFTMQKYNLQKILSKKPKSFK
jgi:hypothetical protein